MTRIKLSKTPKHGFFPAIRRSDGWVHACQADYQARVDELEAQGMTTSDAQGVVDAELLNTITNSSQQR